MDTYLYDLNWHSLPNDLQKDLQQLIHRMQNGVVLTVGPFETVNRELFKIVCNFFFKKKKEIFNCGTNLNIISKFHYRFPKEYTRL